MMIFISDMGFPLALIGPSSMVLKPAYRKLLVKLQDVTTLLCGTSQWMFPSKVQMPMDGRG